MTKRRTVVGIVTTELEKFHKRGRIHEATFEVISPKVFKYFPEAKFNPFHLAWYKHHFLKGDLDMLYHSKSEVYEK